MSTLEKLLYNDDDGDKLFCGLIDQRKHVKPKLLL